MTTAGHLRVFFFSNGSSKCPIFKREGPCANVAKAPLIFSSVAARLRNLGILWHKKLMSVISKTLRMWQFSSQTAGTIKEHNIWKRN